MKGHTLPGPFQKKTGDVKDVLSYLEKGGKAETPEEAAVAIEAARQQTHNIEKTYPEDESDPFYRDNYIFGETEAEKKRRMAGEGYGNVPNK